MAEACVTYETDGPIAIITLNRPEKLNAINDAVRAEAKEAFLRADEDDDVTVVVLRGNGRSFCVGYDIGAGEVGDDAPQQDALQWQALLDDCLAFEMLPWHLQKPVIASVHGHTLGGGCQLAMFCDLTISADNCLFGEPESRFSEPGPVAVMPWLIGYKRARELLYFGDLIDAERALEIGMVNKVVPLAELADATMAYAKRLSLIGAETLTTMKRVLNRGAETAGFNDAMNGSVEGYAPLYAIHTDIRREFEAITQKDGLRAALKWRKAQFDG